jgi:uncharacterized protein
MRNSRTIVLILLVLLVCASILFQIFSENNERKYVDELIRMRAEKDLFFKNGPQSPIQDQNTFKQLSYFSPDLNYRLPVLFSEKSDSSGTLLMKMTDGLSEPFIHAGDLLFSFRREEFKLMAFKRINDKLDDRLFVPFFDLTNDSLTYGGGRYLEIDLQEKPLNIDFNLCYQPYCAYNKKYVCPVPPLKNRLNIPILAGELMPAKAN